MNQYTKFILKYKISVVFFFLASTIICAGLSTMVGVNYKFADYLPDDAKSTHALDVMNEEYDQSVTNLRVMIYDVSIAKALEYKDEITAVEGVKEIQWLDDSANINAPLESEDQDTIDTWYKDNNALYQITIDETNGEQVIGDIRKIIGDENCMDGTAVSDALAPVMTSLEVQQIVLFVIPLILVVLILTTTSWFEPILFMSAIGVAIMLNRGTNLMFGTISFVTNAAGSVLQLAVSMDYAIFLLHRFLENRHEGMEVQEAMVKAVKQSMGSVLSSGLTTVSGFAALILMRFKIGPDMGWVMAKAIVLSLVCVLCFLPALTLICYKLIDKTQHRSFIPKFDKFSRAVLKIRIPVLTIFILLIIPCILGQQKNDFFYGGSQVYSTEETHMGRDMIAIEEEYGESNTLVLMVPIGDMEKEAALNEDLKDLDGVISVISYVNSVGQTVPEGFVPSSTLSKLYSEHYSRFVVMVDSSEAKDGWYEKVNEVRETGEKYYGNTCLLAGDLASTEDLKTTIVQDTARVNLLAVGFVFLILLFNFKSISLPVILTLVIETSIWMNLTVPYFQNSTLHYIAYLIISSVQLGATIDYGILFTDRYLEHRKRMGRKMAAFETIKACTVSIFTSAVILTLAGVILGKISTNLVLSQLGILIGRGAMISFVLVIFVLPTLLMLFDKVIEKTTLHSDFYLERR